MKKLTNSYELLLTDTLTGKKRLFEPCDGERVLMYVCGITPYDYAHIGHGRCYVTFDLLYRLLKFLDYKVIYCRNFTDIDDKLIARAQKEYNNPADYTKVADKYIQAFEHDMKELNCLKPDFEPRVTQTIPEIIDFIKGLLDAGKAYVADGDVYFSIDSFKDYGKLSKRDLQDLQVGARVQVREDKHNPLDFVLWKKTQEGTGWDSPWGYGRPGWHIECSAMANKFLGVTIDIHAGGMDLIFPHHENEIAQSEGLHNKTFACYWLHNAFVQINQEKMSKSLGNFVTLHDIYTRFNPMVVRYYFLLHHYRSPLDFSAPDIEAASKSYQRLSKFFSNIPADTPQELCLSEVPLIELLLHALCDDLNVAKFFGLLFDNLTQLQEDPVQASLVKAILQQVLGLTMEPLPEVHVEITPEIQLLIDARQEARRVKDWVRADVLRDELKALGVEVHDKKL